MDKNSIKPYATQFIKAANLKEWDQEAHNAFVAYVMKREAALSEEQVASVMEIQAALPALCANASAFRQLLQSKEWALLPKSEAADKPSSRYAGLI